MPHVHDVKHALATVVDQEWSPADPHADLARARAAAGVRLRRRFRLGLSALATAAVLGVASVAVLDDSPSAPAVSTEPDDGGVRLVAEQFDATPYTFDLTPAGWSVQGQRPQSVTIAPDDGSTSSHPDDFRGKLVILFDTNPPDGRPVTHDDREFWVRDDSGYTTVATRTVPGEPGGVVRIQYPGDTGWDLDSMLDFLGSVHVGPLAQHGFG